MIKSEKRFTFRKNVSSYRLVLQKDCHFPIMRHVGTSTFVFLKPMKKENVFINLVKFEIKSISLTYIMTSRPSTIFDIKYFEKRSLYTCMLEYNYILK